MRRLFPLSTLLCLFFLGSTTQAQSIGPEERELVELINAARQEAGVQPLTIDLQLSEIARAHSLDMVQNRFFSHISPTTGDLGNRLRANEVPYRRAGENIAVDYSVGEAHQAFMTSPHHRENLLDPTFTHVGVGIVEMGGRLMVTEAFMSLQPGAEAVTEDLGQGSIPEEAEAEPAVTGEPDAPQPGLLAPPPELGAVHPQPEPPAAPQPEPPAAPALPQVVDAIPQPWSAPLSAALQGARDLARPPAAPAPEPAPGEPEAQAPEPPASDNPELTPGIWVVDEDGTRYRIEIAPETLLRMLSSL